MTRLARVRNTDACHGEEVYVRYASPLFLLSSQPTETHHPMSRQEKDMETTLNNSSQPTSVSVLMINAQGMMLSVQGQDYFISYNRVPWLRNARISSALNVRMAGPNAIEWPELDVDLEIESLKHPERYPLVIKQSPLDVI